MGFCDKNLQTTRSSKRHHKDPVHAYTKRFPTWVVYIIESDREDSIHIPAEDLPIPVAHWNLLWVFEAKYPLRSFRIENFPTATREC